MTTMPSTPQTHHLTVSVAPPQGAGGHTSALTRGSSSASPRKTLAAERVTLGKVSMKFNTRTLNFKTKVPELLEKQRGKSSMQTLWAPAASLGFSHSLKRKIPATSLGQRRLGSYPNCRRQDTFLLSLIVQYAHYLPYASHTGS